MVEDVQPCILWKDCAVGETGACLQSEKFSVNMHCFCCDLGAAAFTQFSPSSHSTVQTLPVILRQLSIW